MACLWAIARRPIVPKSGLTSSLVRTCRVELHKKCIIFPLSEAFRMFGFVLQNSRRHIISKGSRSYWLTIIYVVGFWFLSSKPVHLCVCYIGQMLICRCVVWPFWLNVRTFYIYQCPYVSWWEKRKFVLPFIDRWLYMITFILFIYLASSVNCICLTRK